MKAPRINVVPVSLELPADVLTPVSAYLRLRGQGEAAFLIESVEQGERLSRYSYLGFAPRETLRIRDGRVQLETGGRRAILPGGVLEALEARLGRYRLARDPALPPFQGGAVGYLGFDCVGEFESVLKTGKADEPAEDAGLLMVFANLLAFDHLKSKAYLIANVFTDEESLEAGTRRARAQLRRLAARLAEPADASGDGLAALERRRAPSRGGLPAKAALGRARYVQAAREIQRRIGRGDIFQCVLADRFRFPVGVEPFEVYRALRRVNPSPYQFHLDLDGRGRDVLLGASPEMLVRCEGGAIETHPIAGTRPRGAEEAEDRRLERDLLRSAKEKAEHLMLVDLGRNDLGRVCRPGTVRVEELMKVERYSHVMHLTSRVTGRLRPGVSSLSALAACFPAGTLSGAPKIRAIQILSGLEPFRRGFYGGAVLRYGFDGSLDSCIAIRSLRIRDGIGQTLAGAGIVADSRPAAEYDEVVSKSLAVRRAAALAGRTEGRTPLRKGPTE